MAKEEFIKNELSSKFSFLQEIRLPRQRRIFLEVAYDNFAQVFEFIVKKLEFSQLCTITGLDEPQNLSFIYHLASKDGIVINLKTSVSKQKPVIKSIMPYFPNAQIYERELVDLFGAQVEGLPAGNRYPLTDDWPAGQYPLRKDWKPDIKES